MSKMRITFYISRDVVESAKNAAYWTPGMTLSSLAEQALSNYVAVLEEQREAPFPPRENDLTKGRPAK
jgi:hypothetical protein